MNSEYMNLLRPDGTVIIPASVAEPLLRIIVRGLSQRANPNGGGGRVSPDAMGVLSALNATAAREDQRCSAAGTVVSETGIIGSGSRGERVGAREAAALMGCTDRAIRKACQEGRLPATKIGPTWLINVEDLDRHRFGEAKEKEPSHG